MELSTENIEDPEAIARIKELDNFLSILNDETANNKHFFNIGDLYNDIVNRLW